MYVHWVFDLFLSIFQLIEIIFHFKKCQVNYPMILLTSVFLEIVSAQIISICNYFSGLSSELAKYLRWFFFYVSSNNQRFTTHSSFAQAQLMPSQATLPNLTFGPCPQPPHYIHHQSLSNPSLKQVSNPTSPLHLHYH